MKTIIQQIQGYVILIANNVCFMLISDKAYSPQIKIVCGILGLIFVLVGLYDYQFNYKKTGKFKVSLISLIVLGMAIWITKSSYLFIGINAVLLVVFILWKKRLTDKENLTA